MKPKILVAILLLAAGSLAAKGFGLLYKDWQDDLRLKLVKNDLDIFWGHLNQPETPKVVSDYDQPEATDSIEIRRLWGNQEQAEKEHRQEIVKLINEQRQVVNERENETYPLLELKPHPLLEQSARQAFENIAKTKQFEHQDLTVLLSRGEPFDSVGENLATESYVNPTRVVYDWYLSESHRELMLGDWEFIGVWSGWVEGLAEEGREPVDRYVTVAHFGE